MSTGQRRGMIGKRQPKRVQTVQVALPGLKAFPRNRAPKGKKVKGAIAYKGVELKYVDIANTAYVADTTGTVTFLNLVAVGDDNTTRDGRQVLINSLQVRGNVFPVDSITNDTDCRVIFFWDNANNSGSGATIAQVLTAANSHAFPLIDNANRFTILKDMTFPVGRTQDTATTSYSHSPSIHSFDFYMKIKQITQYSGTTAAIGSIQNGALGMITIGDQAAGGGGTFTIATRVRFSDT